jgi:hypothetical protein
MRRTTAEGDLRLPGPEGSPVDTSPERTERQDPRTAQEHRTGMENEVVLLTTIPAGDPVGAYGRESWVSV